MLIDLLNNKNVLGWNNTAPSIELQLFYNELYFNSADTNNVLGIDIQSLFGR